MDNMLLETSHRSKLQASTIQDLNDKLSIHLQEQQRTQQLLNDNISNIQSLEYELRKAVSAVNQRDKQLV